MSIPFWEFAAFIANSLVFLLIGLRVAGMAFADNTRVKLQVEKRKLYVGWAIVPVAIFLVLAGRAVTVCAGARARTRAANIPAVQ